MSKENPVSKKDVVNKRVDLELESDIFTPEEQARIVSRICADIKDDYQALDKWLTDVKKWQQQYDGEKPSVIEGLTKEWWQSDRNMRVCTAVCDTFMTTLFSTCWNPDSIHFVDTEINDVDNKDALTKFTKALLRQDESNITRQILDYGYNRIVNGFSLFKVRWDVKYEWVDKRIPKYKTVKGKQKFNGYDIKTEKVRFEKAIIENIPDVEDFLCPEYGKSIQDVPHCILKLHLTPSDIEDYGKRDIFLNVTEAHLKSIQSTNSDHSDERSGKNSEYKQKFIGVDNETSQQDIKHKNKPVDVYEWYGWIDRKGKLEQYRVTIDMVTRTFYAAKPLRKITRTGKRPFIGSGFIHYPGYVRGKSLPSLISDICNQMNNIYNQKSDFQYFENCPDGYYVPDDQQTKQEMKRVPGVLHPVGGTKASDSVYLPNYQRSMQWAYQDLQFLFECLERLTGSASYFLTSSSKDSTATRDNIIAQKSENRFGIWVADMLNDICDVLTLYVQFYQDWAPKDLANRILGKDGKKLIQNFSIESIRGNYDVKMTADIISGSKSLEKQIRLWGFNELQKSPWFNPQLNPYGSWLLTLDTMKGVGFPNPDKYLPPEPPKMKDYNEDAESELIRIMQGEDIEPPEGESEAAGAHLMTHERQKEEKYHEIDDEFKPIFDKHLFETRVNYRNFIQKKQTEMIAEKLAMNQIQRIESAKTVLDKMKNEQNVNTIPNSKSMPMQGDGMESPDMESLPNETGMVTVE